MTQHLDFLRQRFGGKNWVLARRSVAIVRRYGEDVICVSPQKYAAVEKEYRALYGAPHDTTRANLYCALRHAVKLLEKEGAKHADFIDNAHAALEAERNAK